MKIYGPMDLRDDDDRLPSMLAIGDSWFWYPRNNIVRALIQHERLKEAFKWIQLVGYNGARLEQYVDGRYAERISWELEPQNRGHYSAIFLSGAGNDAVDYKLALFRDCRKAQSFSDCFDPLALDYLVKRMGAAMRTLIHQIRRAYGHDKSPPIFLHSYDYPIADGRGFDLLWLQITGPWLESAMNARAVPKEGGLRRDICRGLIDALHAEFDEIALSEGVYLIDSRGCLCSDLNGDSYKKDWANELHPSWDGFTKIVDRVWIPFLANHLSHAIRA